MVNRTVQGKVNRTVQEKVDKRALDFVNKLWMVKNPILCLLEDSYQLVLGKME